MPKPALTAEQIETLLGLVNDMIDYWDNGNPVQPGSEIAEEITKFMGR